MKVSQLIKQVRNHRGPVFVDMVMRDDTAGIQVVKADLLHFLAQMPPDADAPMFANLNGGVLNLHAAP